MTVGDDLGGGAVLFHIGRKNRIEYLVGRQALVVALIGTQLGRWGFHQHVVRHDLAAGAGVDEAA